MRFETILVARVSEKQAQKVENIKRDTGLTTSQLFRRLIENAEFSPPEFVVNLDNPKTNEQRKR